MDFQLLFAGFMVILPMAVAVIYLELTGGM